MIARYDSGSQIHAGDLLIGIKKRLLSDDYQFSGVCISHNFFDFRIKDPDALSTNMSECEICVDKKDVLIIYSLVQMIMIQIQRQYQLHSCRYELYCMSDIESINSFHHYISEWWELEGLLLIDCSNSYESIPICGVLDKMKRIFNNDDNLYRLFASLIKIPIRYEGGRSSSNIDSISKLPYLSYILFDIYMDNIDRFIKDCYPVFKYARFRSYMVIGFNSIDEKITFMYEKESIF